MGEPRSLNEPQSRTWETWLQNVGLLLPLSNDSLLTGSGGCVQGVAGC